MATVIIKRVYDKPNDDDGARVLIDKLWPRGIRKDALLIDAWYKSVTPCSSLRKWFHEDMSRWPAFSNAYLHELSQQNRNHALVLKEYLEKLDQDND